MNKLSKIADKTLVLHWIEKQKAWSELPWLDWVRFRGFGKDRSTLLIGATAGEHYFLVCMLGSHGELWNVIPYKYVISNNARMVHGFDGLGIAERTEVDRLEHLPCPTIDEMDRLDELGTRGFSANLPPTRTIQNLWCTLPGIAGAPVDAACWHFLSAIGVCHTGTKAN